MSCAKIALVNLMPVKPDTERDFLASLPAGLAAVDFFTPLSHVSRHTSQEHISRHYSDTSAIPQRGDYDAVIVTGAPVEHLPFEQVDYWHEITSLLDCCVTRGVPMLNICWGAFAAAYHLYGVAMEYLPSKVSGIFRQSLVESHDVMNGMADGFLMPHSRHAAWRQGSLPRELSVLAVSEKGGPSIMADNRGNLFVSGHFEYNALTLHNEYCRDLGKGLSPVMPENYYPANNPDNTPLSTWESPALQFFKNWTEWVIEKKRAKIFAQLKQNP